MKIIITIFCLFISINVFAQFDQKYVETVWDYASNAIARLDSGKGQAFKYINKRNKISKIEYWKYDTINDSLFQFQIKYSEKKHNKSKNDYISPFVVTYTYYDEYFLILNGKLVYETDGYTHHFFKTKYEHATDSIRWYEECYFSAKELIHYHSGGHGKSELDEYDPEKEIFQLYEKRYRELVSHLQQIRR